MKVAALILAAGQASRFGAAKQLLTINGQNLVQRACQLAMKANCEPIVVISGAHQEAIKQCELPPHVELLENPDWSRGMGSSLALGVQTIIPQQPDAVLILLADQPAITLKTIEQLYAEMNQCEVSIVRCQHAKVQSPPTLFSSQHFASLAQLHDDLGGKEIIQKNKDALATISAPEAAWDIDTPESWAQYQEYLRRSDSAR